MATGMELTVTMPTTAEAVAETVAKRLRRSDKLRRVNSSGMFRCLMVLGDDRFRIPDHSYRYADGSSTYDDTDRITDRNTRLPSLPRY